MATHDETTLDDSRHRIKMKSSKAWEHFTFNKETANQRKTVTCSICKAELAWHGSTTAMLEHLKRKHVVYGVSVGHNIDDPDFPR